MEVGAQMHHNMTFQGSFSFISPHCSALSGSGASPEESGINTILLAAKSSSQTPPHLCGPDQHPVGVKGTHVGSEERPCSESFRLNT